MTTNTIGRVICKIVAVYFAVQAAERIAYAVPFAFSNTASFASILVTLLTAIGAPLVLAFLLWKYADRIAGPGNAGAEQAVSTDLTQDDLLEAGLILIGVAAILFAISRAVPDELLDLWHRLSRDEERFVLDYALVQGWGRRIGYIVQIALGFGLIYGRQSIIDYVHRARRIGSGGS